MDTPPSGARSDLRQGRGLILGAIVLALVSSVAAVAVVFVAIDRGHEVEAQRNEAEEARFLLQRSRLLAAVDREHGLLELVRFDAGQIDAREPDGPSSSTTQLLSRYAEARSVRQAIQAEVFDEVVDLTEGTDAGAVIVTAWLAGVSAIEIPEDGATIEVLDALGRLRSLAVEAGGAGELGSTPWLALLADQSRRPVVWDINAQLVGTGPMLSERGLDPFRVLPPQSLVDGVGRATAVLEDLAESPDLARLSELIASDEAPSPVELAAIGERVHEGVVDLVETLHLSGIEGAESRASRTATGALLTTVLAAGVLLVGVGGAAALIRRRRRLDDDLVALARTDPITGLRNRLALTTEFGPTLANPRRAGHALLHVDLDRFKAVNDTYGHEVGDQVLIAFARRLIDAVGDQVAGIARVGGDEFVVVLHDLSHPEGSAQQLGTRILEHMAAPVRVGERSIDIGVSIGMAVANEAIGLEDLLLEADIALYRAKGAGRGRTSLFDQVDERDLIRGLDRVFESGEIRVDLQPQVEIATGEVVGVEVLARWEREDGSVLPARDWVGTLEWLGESHRLLEVVADAAARAAATVGSAWQGRFWINVSASDLSGLDAATTLVGCLEATGLPLERFGVEMAETADVVDLDHVAGVLRTLRGRGVNIAIDDFGRGNSPLQHLTLLPLDAVKLDHSVLVHLDQDERQRALVTAVVDICATLSIDLIAEGVESESDLAVLRQFGIRYAQGYATGRPITPHQLGRSLLPGLGEDERPRLDPHRI